METIVLIIAAFITSAISAVIGMGGGNHTTWNHGYYDT